MVNPSNPFGAFDPQSMFDPEKLAAAMRGQNLGAVDMGAVVEAQRRNLEALAQANQVAAQAQVSRAQVDLDEAKRDFDRKQSLVEKHFFSYSIVRSLEEFQELIKNILTNK